MYPLDYHGRWMRRLSHPQDSSHSMTRTESSVIIDTILILLSRSRSRRLLFLHVCHQWFEQILPKVWQVINSISHRPPYKEFLS
ncbi:hypothetical protein H5410_010813 [Solanum commersonii]|uniref:Uncharacterized protein n=1 Tax=Solanum commersonii TaxID=4109 RepID=A0A9J6AMV0_SOLCO|nr:hypothetical protein H5410_010813 [Solanum commersonii]